MEKATETTNHPNYISYPDNADLDKMHREIFKEVFMHNYKSYPPIAGGYCSNIALAVADIALDRYKRGFDENFKAQPSNI